MTSNASWVVLSPAKGTVTPNNPETRVEASVDWSKVPAGGAQTAILTFSATAKGQPTQNTQVYFYATNNAVSSGFNGEGLSASFP